ncbi:hypothetical protein H6P81_021693 [Aristolochia fimbriata]|uniref:Uncharacterized protein n=1 Tax=Aristolochia fimbriata TaxID=158543 RepID=A0AAV7DSZ4_ARIFI|nr:hypothetical protein H6P81_021693 [Aristolochia fimbriata]
MPRWATGAAGCVNARRILAFASLTGARRAQRQRPRRSGREHTNNHWARSVPSLKRKLRRSDLEHVAPEATRSRVHLPGRHARRSSPPPPRGPAAPPLGGAAGRRGEQIGRPCPLARLAENTLPQGHSGTTSGGSAPLAPWRGSSRGSEALAQEDPCRQLLSVTGGLARIATPESQRVLEIVGREADGAGDALGRERGRREPGPPPTGRRPTLVTGTQARRMIPPTDTPPRGPRRVALRLTGRALVAPARLAPASWLPIQPALKHGPRSPTCVRSQRAHQTPGCTADPPRSFREGFEVSIPVGTKDGELCPKRGGQRKLLVEARSDTDAQIARPDLGRTARLLSLSRARNRRAPSGPFWSRGERFHVNALAHGLVDPKRRGKPTGGRVQRLEEHPTPLQVSVAPLKTGGPKVPPTPSRTHNRIRSPRQGKSAKWIPELGKRIGSEGWARVPAPNPPAVGGLLEAAPRRARAGRRVAGDGSGTALWGPSPGRTAELVELTGATFAASFADSTLGAFRPQGHAVVGDARWADEVDGAALKHNSRPGAFESFADDFKYADGYCGWQSGLAATIHRDSAPCRTDSPPRARTVGPKTHQGKQNVEPGGFPTGRWSRSSASPQQPGADSQVRARIIALGTGRPWGQERAGELAGRGRQVSTQGRQAEGTLADAKESGRHSRTPQRGVSFYGHRGPRLVKARGKPSLPQDGLASLGSDGVVAATLNPAMGGPHHAGEGTDTFAVPRVEGYFGISHRRERTSFWRQGQAEGRFWDWRSRRHMIMRRAWPAPPGPQYSCMGRSSPAAWGRPSWRQGSWPACPAEGAGQPLLRPLGPACPTGAAGGQLGALVPAHVGTDCGGGWRYERPQTPGGVSLALFPPAWERLLPLPRPRKGFVAPKAQVMVCPQRCGESSKGHICPSPDGSSQLFPHSRKGPSGRLMALCWLAMHWPGIGRRIAGEASGARWTCARVVSSVDEPPPRQAAFPFIAIGPPAALLGRWHSPVLVCFSPEGQLAFEV